MAETPKPIRKAAKKFGKEYSEKVAAHPHFKNHPKKMIKNVRKANEGFKKDAMKHSKEDLHEAHKHMKKHGG